MDNITLGYSFQTLFGAKISGRAYATVQNVFTITNYDGIDPEVANGVDNKVNLWYGNQELSFDGVSVFHAPGLGNSKMVLAQKSNLYFGTGLLSDHQEVKVLDMSDLDGSKNVRFIMRFTAGVQVGFGADVVYYA